MVASVLQTIEKSKSFGLSALCLNQLQPAMQRPELVGFVTTGPSSASRHTSAKGHLASNHEGGMLL